MKILFCLLYIALVSLTSASHMYFVWKKQDRKTLRIQIVILGLAIIVGILAIYDLRDPSVASLLNNISPLEK